MATHSSILAWRIPQTEEPGGFLWEEPGGPWGHRESDTTERLSTDTHAHTQTQKKRAESQRNAERRQTASVR